MSYTYQAPDLGPQVRQKRFEVWPYVLHATLLVWDTMAHRRITRTSYNPQQPDTSLPEER